MPKYSNFDTNFSNIGMIHMWLPWKLFSFQDPPSPVHWCPTFFHPLDPGRPISNKNPSLNDIVDVNEWNQNKNKTKSRFIQIYHAFYCSIYSTNNAVVSLKDGFTDVRRQIQKENFLPIIYCLAQHDAWSWCKSNFL